MAARKQNVITAKVMATGIALLQDEADCLLI
jgi:hypothetical protein